MAHATRPDNEKNSEGTNLIFLGFLRYEEKKSNLYLKGCVHLRHDRAL
jgi:hypothetical protein